MSNFSSPLLKAAEGAKILDVSLVTFRRMLKDGRVQAVHLGKTIRIRRSDLEAIVNTGTCVRSNKEGA